MVYAERIPVPSVNTSFHAEYLSCDDQRSDTVTDVVPGMSNNTSKLERIASMNTHIAENSSRPVLFLLHESVTFLAVALK